MRQTALSEADKTEVDIRYSVLCEIIVHLPYLIGGGKSRRNPSYKREERGIGIKLAEGGYIKRNIALLGQAGYLTRSIKIFSVCLCHADIAALIELCSLAVCLILCIVELDDTDGIGACILTLGYDRPGCIGAYRYCIGKIISILGSR